MGPRSILGASLALLGACVLSCSMVLGLDQVQRVDCTVSCPDGSVPFDGQPPDGPSSDAPRLDSPTSGDTGIRVDAADAGDTGPASCTSDTQCQPPNPRCDTTTGKCVPCLPQNDNCPPGTVCTMMGGSYVCSQGCNTATDCTALDASAANKACCNHVCVDTSSNTQNCSMCGINCGAQSCCASACTNTTTNPSDCGGCGLVCSTNNMATVSCGAGVCDGMCLAGFGDCNGNKLTDGCETNTSSDPANCGGCGAGCSSNNVATLSCSGGNCTSTCAAGFADCNANLRTDGCETSTSSDPANCGGCNAACSANNMATVTCGGGNCTGTCAAGFSDCNGNLRTDGCETNTSSDPANCGGCNAPCSTNNMATVSCTGGSCTGSCAPGFADCNNDLRTDGCEANTLSDPNHCGNCTTVCGFGTSCVNGMCIMSMCSTVAGPALTMTISGWPSSGLQLKALVNTTLTSFVFNNQGMADTVELTDATGATVLFSLSTPASTPAYTASVSWPLAAGVSYNLINIGGPSGNNGMWASYGSFPTSDSSLQVTATWGNNTLQTSFWFTFTNLTTCP